MSESDFTKALFSAIDRQDSFSISIDEARIDLLNTPRDELIKLIDVIKMRKSTAESDAETSQMHTDDTPPENNKSGFTQPKKFIKRKALTQGPEQNKIHISNQYTALATNDTNDDEDNNTDNEDEDNKTAPIILTNKTKWTELSGIFTTKKLNYSKALNVKEGIRIQPQTVTDYRKMTQYLDDKKIQYFSHRLKKDKLLKIVIKGIPEEMDLEEIKHDLHEQGYETEKIERMNNKNKEPIAMVLIALQRKYKSIYNIKTICSLCVVIEALRKKHLTSQCHRCQKFGHVQSGCKVDYRCLKCAKNHSTHLCEKPKTTDAKCANCGGNHPANYKFCAENPNNPNNKKPKITPASETQTKSPWNNNLNQQQSPPPASNTKTENNNNKTNKTDRVATLIGRLFIQYNQLKPTAEQNAEFNKTTLELLKEIS